MGWSAALLVAGAVFGSMTKSLLDAAHTNKLLSRVLSAQGIDGVYTTLTQFLAAATTAYVVTVIVRLSSDENSGLGEAVLAGSVSRWTWLLSAVAAAMCGAAVLLACAGLGNGVGAGLTLGEPATILRLTVAALAYLPAMAVVAGVAALGVALRRPGIGWLAVTLIVAALYLGALLRLPRWLVDASPVGPHHSAVVGVGHGADRDGGGCHRAGCRCSGWLYRRRDASREEPSRHRLRVALPSVIGLTVFALVAVPARRDAALLAGLGLPRGVLDRHRSCRGLYLRKLDPAALERRTHAGPEAETRTVQKIVITGNVRALSGMLVLVSVLDYRFGWSRGARSALGAR